MAKMGVIYDKDIKERVFALFSDMVSSPSSISFEGNSIVKNGVATRIIATLRDGLTLFAGETLNYQVKHGNTVLSSGSATTDNNGQISIDYTGTALGKIDVIVKYRTLLQETFVIRDSDFVDIATTGNKNTYWAVFNNPTITTDSTGTLVEEVTNGVALYPSTVPNTTLWANRRSFPTDFVVEFDLSDVENTNFLLTYNTSTNKQVMLANGHWKFIVSATNGIQYIKDNGSPVTVTSDTIPTNVYVGFNDASGSTLLKFKFKNFCVYPI